MHGEHANELSIISQSLSSNADILLYGCNFAEGNVGLAAVNTLSQLTGADIAASDDLTGNGDLGGDWQLEVISGSIEAENFNEQLDGFNEFNSLLNSAPIGEVGTTGDSLSHVTQTITLNNTYINPVVFALLPSDDGGHATTVRIDNVTSNSFDIRLVESFGRDGPHTNEEVSYMVFEAGSYTLADGTKIEVGLTDSTSIQGPNADGDFHSVTFNQTFDSRPILLTQVQTDNNNLLTGDGAPNRQAFLDTRTDNINTNSFDVAIERYESLTAADSLASSEQIGYFAIESGSGQWSTSTDDSSSLNFVAGSATVIDNVGSPNETVINYGQNLTNDVNRFAVISSYNDNDHAQLRLDNDSATNMQLFIEEERTANNEETHANETVDYFVIGGNATLYAVDTDGDGVADGIDIDDDNDGIIDTNEVNLLPAQEVLNLSGAQANSYTVTDNGEITITISGGDGGDATTLGGQGATVSATFQVKSGDVIEYVVADAGENGQSGGGGGSTGVFINDVLVMVAGGGGGGDNSTGAIGLGGQATIDGAAGTGTSPGTAGVGGNGGGATTFAGTNQAAGGGGINSAGSNASAGGGGAGGGAQADIDAVIYLVIQ